MLVRARLAPLPVLARLCLFNLNTLLYAPGRVCMFPLEPIWVGKHGSTPLHECVYSFLSPFGPMCQGKPAVCTWGCVYVPFRARLFENTRARSSPFGPVRPENLAVRPWACVHGPVRARLGLYAQVTWLYTPF